MDRAALLRRFQAGETHFTFEYECRRAENLPVWLSTTVSVCAVPGTEKVDCFTYTYDVTDKTLERQILSRLPLLGFDVIGLLYVQTGACRYFRIKKMRPGALYEHVEDYYASIGGDIERVVLPEQRERVREGLRISAITAGLAHSEIYPFAYAITNWQGRRAQKLLQFSYLDESRRTIFFCKSDITEQYENEHRQIEALQAAKLEADRANEAKSAFLSSMSHDLRTPLNGVLGFTRFALREADPAKKQAYLEKVAASGELLLDLVNDTLELSRIESGKYVLEPEALQGREAALAVVLSVRPAAELKQITLQAEPADFPDERIWADRIKLQKIFLNLLSNAIKYTPRGGTVRACVQRLDPPQQGCSHRLVVEDTGIGMRPESSAAPVRALFPGKAAGGGPRGGHGPGPFHRAADRGPDGRHHRGGEHARQGDEVHRGPAHSRPDAERARARGRGRSRAAGGPVRAAVRGQLSEHGDCRASAARGGHAGGVRGKRRGGRRAVRRVGAGLFRRGADGSAHARARRLRGDGQNPRHGPAGRRVGADHRDDGGRLCGRYRPLPRGGHERACGKADPARGAARRAGRPVRPRPAGCRAGTSGTLTGRPGRPGLLIIHAPRGAGKAFPGCFFFVGQGRGRARAGRQEINPIGL
jgi:signal transduction histidine kinase